MLALYFHSASYCSYISIFQFFSVPDSRWCGLQQTFWHTFFSFSKPFFILVPCKEYPLPYSLPFDWRVLVSKTFTHSSPVIIFIVYTGEDITDMPRCVSQIFIKQFKVSVLSLPKCYGLGLVLKDFIGHFSIDQIAVAYFGIIRSASCKHLWGVSKQNVQERLGVHCHSARLSYFKSMSDFILAPEL